MSDTSVAAALRSPAKLVVIEAPGGCGKTFQASRYAAEAATNMGGGRVLVLAHTHAACDVFANRIVGGNRVDIRTIDSLISQVASAYHSSLGLPADASAWARREGDQGYRALAGRAATLLKQAPMVAYALSQRYPLVICDEHQDAAADQHAIVMAMHECGSSLRIFGDPMQNIAGSRSETRAADNARWQQLKAQADAFEELDYPHRWEKSGARELGHWILAARARLKDGGCIDLRGELPSAISVVFADNVAEGHGRYTLERDVRYPIDRAVDREEQLLVLAAHNVTIQALRPFFNRKIPIWEGHTRDALAKLSDSVQNADGDAIAVGRFIVTFVQAVATGFTASSYSNVLLQEIADGCTARKRLKPAILQELGRLILREPNHRGVAKMLSRLLQLIEENEAFSQIKIDNPREYREAIRLGEFANCDEGYSEISRRRTYARPMPPLRALSTIHKAKGLEAKNVVLMPCDAQHFRNTQAARCLLYVALSRATNSITLVVPRSGASPLFEF